MFLQSLGLTRVNNIQYSIKKYGLNPRVHGNKHLRSHNAPSFEVTENLVWFIFTYAEQNALLLPGRVPGYRWSDIQLLPSSKSREEYGMYTA